MDNKCDNISIAIDGPAGAGKSTISKLVAKKLNIEYVDTGAMYRAFTLKLLEEKIDLTDEFKILEELKNTSIDFIDGHIYLDSKIVDKQIRDNIVSQNVSNIAKIKEVREGMIKLQRKIAEGKDIIMDGRDIGTVVLPNAKFKFFIIASIEERAKRRYKDLIKKEEKNISLEKVKKEIEKRDKIDSTRAIAPLKKSVDAIEIDTTNKSVNECVKLIVDIVEGR
ncbi:(d)CMP kinase [Anaerosalibacter bizertensis]|uniref:Cytidylate kinase n=1 Tax=Anaerosalibacter bizertensis TaxID=932217 RepID=A0A9Q4FKY1_9FIRM|nr:(d)CMP kinase [Anaerosalibacter bizertensis]MBV1818469.1 (d)CMP kinase [Bacteroidales bacterium MSK.15.36]MBU5293209.1 (d)CMP kinase [Anaerosalibacter bizertensis]MCB5559687.1 (d)CMP kinase [Anaerosalibacter bizertensis]MCG4564278.1 (d)CMP kinase [Anaerosalibacter bizertensis]MCG4581709.1 (d)CMP kinase [Anaerosalibacter bizertensis]